MATAPLLVRAGTLPGRLIVVLQDGAVLGICRRAVEDPFTGRVLGFAFEDDEWYEGPKFIPQHAVVGFGENAILLEDRSQIMQLHQAAEIRLILKQKETYLEKHVMTENGAYLGEIFDYDFDRSGYAVHYYLHRYLSGDASCALVPAERTRRVGKSLVLVAEGQLIPTEVQPGIRAPWEAVRAPRITPTLKTLDQLRPPRPAAEIPSRERTAAGTRPAPDSVSERFQQKQYAYLLGRHAERDVLTDQGALVIGRGQLIDETVLRRAQESGKFMELAISSRTSATASAQPAESSRGAA